MQIACQLRLLAKGGAKGVALSVAIVSSLVVFAASGCGSKEDAKAAGKKNGGGRPPARVRVIPVREMSLSPRVIAVGTLTAVRTSTIASGANGIVDKYDIEEGQWVDMNAVLSKLRMVSSQRQLNEAEKLLELRKAETVESKSTRDEEIQAAKFRLEAAKIAMKIAKQRHTRALEAYRQGAINREAMDEAEERQKLTLAMFQEAEQNHKLLKAGPRKEKQLQAKAREEAQAENLEYLKAEHAKRTTLAPFAGYVVQEHTEVGQWLAKGDPVVTLADMNHMDVVVNVDQTDIRHVRIGKAAKIRVQGFPRAEVKTSDGTLTGLIVSESATTLTLITDKGPRKTIPVAAIQSRKEVLWTGTIVNIVPRSDWKTGARGFPVKVRLPNRFREIAVESASGKPTVRKVPVLKEGMMVTVTFEGEQQAMFMVPKDALIRSTMGMKVNIFKPSADGKGAGSTFQIGVQTGISKGDLIQITPKPTNPGESVQIVALKPGQKPTGRETLVVEEGGERLMPVQANVIADTKATEKKE